MLYWIQVYALVIAVLMAPFLMLYLVVTLSCQALAVIRLMIRSLGTFRPIRADLLSERKPMRPIRVPSGAMQ